MIDFRPARRLALSALAATLCVPVQAYQLSGTYWYEGTVDVQVDLAQSNPAGPNAPNVVANGPTSAELQAAYVQAMGQWNSLSTCYYTATQNSGCEFEGA